MLVAIATCSALLAGCAAHVTPPGPPPAAQICVETLQDVQQGSNHNVQVFDDCQGGEAICQCFTPGSTL